MSDCACVDHTTIALIGGPLDGAIARWDDIHLDMAFPSGTTYAWYRLCVDRRHAIYRPLIYQRVANRQENDAA